MDTSHKRVQFPRNLTEVVDNYVGANGEIVIDTSRSEIRLQDGRKKGGWRILNLTQLRKLFIGTDSEFGEVKFANDLIGFMVRTSTRMWRLRTFVAGDGLNLSSLTGVEGNITISVKERLAAVSVTRVVDCNSMKETGAFITDSAAANYPAGLAAGNASLSVVAGIGNDGTLYVLQSIVSLSSNSNTTFIRRFRADAWTAWA